MEFFEEENLTTLNIDNLSSFGFESVIKHVAASDVLEFGIVDRKQESQNDDPDSIAEEEPVDCGREVESDPDVVPALKKKCKEDKPKRIFKCNVGSCLYSSGTQRDLKRHHRKHTGEKPYKCPVCSKSFSRSDKLKLHKLIHENTKKPNVCDICGYSTIYIDSLTKHKRTHNEERPYKCQLCPYKAKDSSQIIVHLRSHTGDQPYMCTFEKCSASFSTSSGLVRHRRSHTNERPYQCPYDKCNYRATVKCNLTKHINRLHKTKPSNSNHVLHPAPLIQDKGDQVHSTCTNNSATSDVTMRERKLPHLTNSNDADTLNVVASSSLIPGCNQKLDDDIFDRDFESKLPCKKRKSAAVKSLPYFYSCNKKCQFYAESFDVFTAHLKEKHGEDVSVSELKTTGKRRSGSGRSKNMCVEEVNLKFQKLYKCTFCSAKFVREDSWKCHLKQHSESNVAPPGFLMEQSDQRKLIIPTNF